MPNYCTNAMYITTDNQEIIDYFQSVSFPTKEVPGIFDHFIPEPEFENPEYGRSWRESQWGTKWDAHCPTISIDAAGDGKTVICVLFDTAWSPPLTFVHQFQQQTGANVELYWYEPGERECGIYSDGHYEDYEFEPDKIPQVLYDRLIPIEWWAEMYEDEPDEMPEVVEGIPQYADRREVQVIHWSEYHKHIEEILTVKMKEFFA